jgi:hypothetical protein
MTGNGPETLIVVFAKKPVQPQQDSSSGDSHKHS